MSTNKTVTQKLTLSAMLIGIATVLSCIKLLDLPYGGSITAGSMVPIILIGYLFGNAWGVLSALCYIVIQLLLGMNALSYATSAGAAIAIILLDYVFAFTLIGLSGTFKKLSKNAAVSLPLAALIACLLRYVCHVISGCTVWAGLSIPSGQALLYSLAYNATYMLPVTLVTVIAAAYLARTLSFENGTIRRVATTNQKGSLLTAIANGVLALGVIADIVLLSAHIQNPESGEFDFSGLAEMNFVPLICVTVAAVVVFAAMHLVAKNQAKTNG